MLDMHQKSDFVTMLWCLWKRRNKKTWEDAEREPSVRLVRDFLHNWQQVLQPTSDACNISNQQAICKWCKPNAGELKCNMDAMIFPEQNQFGISICICNDRGEFVTAKTAVFLGVPSVHEAKVCELGFDKVSIELDGRPVVDGILSKSNHQTEFGCI